MLFIKNIKGYIYSIKGKWLFNAFISMLIIVVITILPSIFELIGTALVSNVNDFWNNCYTSGQFLIYGISLIATTIATIRIQNQNMSGLLIIIISIYCIAYAAVNIATAIIGKYLPDTKIVFNNNLLLAISISGMIIGMICCLYSQYKIQQLTIPDIKEIDDKNIERLSNKLEI